MNLSHAVALVLGRIYEDLAGPRRPLRGKRGPESGVPAAPARLAELEALMGHWTELLVDIGAEKAGKPERLAADLRRIFARTGLTPKEIRLLRGLLSKIQVKLGVRKRGRRVSAGSSNRDVEIAQR
jgi:tRNA C32,U32 (ribose-2'-O)-methylase TrmJ